MKVGIISDTHGLLRPEVAENLGGCDVILHGGDINRRQIIDELELIAPVYAVRGNNDKEWASDIPYTLELELGRVKIWMSHKKKDLPADLTPYGLAVIGHTHKYEETRTGKTIILNPGSCGPRRFHQAITMAVADISGSNVEIRRIDIAHKASGILSNRDLSDLGKQIETVMRETDKNRTPGEISSGHGYDRDLTEQIVRLYLTHPGVSAERIREKMGL